MKNKLLLVLVFLISTITSFAQNSISGTVVDLNEEPLVGVIISSNDEKVAVTDVEGNFQFTSSDINPILKISYVGYKTKEIENISNNIGLITLTQGNELLGVEVIGERANKFARNKTHYVSKLPLDDLENAQVYSTVTTELLESQIATSFDEALVNATGIDKRWEATGRSAGEGTGFYSLRGFAVQPGLVDGLPGYTFSTLDPSYIERIEVIKGPNATLFGSTSRYGIGGEINVVTKKPFEGKGGSLSYTNGSFNTHRFTVDYNTQITKKGPYLRVNSSYLDKKTFQDAGFTKTFFIAPSLTYRASNKLNLSGGVEYSRSKLTNPSMLFLRRGLPLVSKNTDQLNPDSKKSFTSNDIFLTTPTFNTRFIADYKLGNQWTSQTMVGSSTTKTNGYYQYVIEGGATVISLLSQVTGNPQLAPVKPYIDPIVNPMLNEANTMLQQDLFTRVFDKRDSDVTRINTQQNFIGDFKIGTLRNRMVVGLDYTQSVQKFRTRTGNVALLNRSNFPQLLGFFDNPPADIPAEYVPSLNAVAQQIRGAYSSVPYFDAFLTAKGDVYDTSFAPNATYQPTRAQLDPIFNKINPFNDIYRDRTFATYISNVLNINPKLNVSLGARIDHFVQEGKQNTDKDNYTKTTFSPKAGFVYQPILKTVSLFANYQTGFKNSNIQVNPFRTFAPVKSKQFEGGVKTNLLEDRYNFGVNYYHIVVNDRPITDPSSVLFGSRIPITEITSKGFEFEANANPIDGLNIRGSFSKNNTKITDATTPAFGGKPSYVVEQIKDKRTPESGPETVYSFWSDYKFQEVSTLDNFGVGFGFSGTSEYLAVNNSIAGVFTIPQYTILNSTVYYDHDKFRIGLKANNLTNKVYYKGWGTVNPQSPRSYLETVQFKF